MKKIIIIATLIATTQISKAQLYSSGNNIIAGTNVGIGTNAPAAKLEIRGTSGDLMRLQGTDTAGASRFTILNDAGFGNRATFTRYGSKFPGGYPGLATQFPYSNLLAFGCNVGSFFISTNGKVGLSVISGGTSKMKFFIDSTLKTGLGGNSHPMSHIHINNTDGTNDTVRITNNTTGHTGNDGLTLGNNGNAAFLINRENSTLELGTNNASNLKISSTGLVSIGNVTTPAGYKLYVETGILTERVKVAVKTNADWADYVFADNYNLMSLPSLAEFIKTNRHLPNVPSADEVVESGIDMAKMDAKLLEKIEELTLHIIELNKRIEALEKDKQ